MELTIRANCPADARRVALVLDYAIAGSGEARELVGPGDAATWTLDLPPGAAVQLALSARYPLPGILPTEPARTCRRAIGRMFFHVPRDPRALAKAWPKQACLALMIDPRPAAPVEAEPVEPEAEHDGP